MFYARLSSPPLNCVLSDMNFLSYFVLCFRTNAHAFLFFHISLFVTAACQAAGQNQRRSSSSSSSNSARVAARRGGELIKRLLQEEERIESVKRRFQSRGCQKFSKRKWWIEFHSSATNFPKRKRNSKSLRDSRQRGRAQHTKRPKVLSVHHRYVYRREREIERESEKQKNSERDNK